MKYYYHLSNTILCGACGWTMYPDADNGLHDPHAGLFLPKYTCVNDNCPQRAKKIALKPIEAEVVE